MGAFILMGLAFWRLVRERGINVANELVTMCENITATRLHVGIEMDGGLKRNRAVYERVFCSLVEAWFRNTLINALREILLSLARLLLFSIRS
jgi:hypothetical protein